MLESSARTATTTCCEARVDGLTVCSGINVRGPDRQARPQETGVVSENVRQ